MGTSGTDGGCSSSFVPLWCKKTSLDPRRIYWASPAESVGNGILLHTCHDTTRVFTRKWCPRPSSVVSIYTSNESYMCPFGQAVRFSEKRQRSTTLGLCFPKCSVFLELHCIFSFSITTRHQLDVWHMIFRSVPSNALLGGGG